MRGQPGQRLRAGVLVADRGGGGQGLGQGAGCWSGGRCGASPVSASRTVVFVADCGGGGEGLG